MNYRIIRLFIIASLTFIFLPREIIAQNVFERKLTFTVKDTELRKVLEIVQKQTNIHFVYSPNTIDDSKKVNFNLKDKTLKNFFSELLTNYGISNKMLSDNKILLFIEQVKKGNLTEVIPNSIEKKEVSFIAITGTIKDSVGNPVEGVTVTDKGSKATAVSDKKGFYTIRLPDYNTTLKFKHIGYAPIEKGVDASGMVNVSMFEVASNLNEVVVIGYGTVKKKDLTGSVSKVNISDMEKAPVKSFDEALAGRVAGVQVSSMDGQPGASVSISIRGNNSLTQDNSPLYIIDGFPMENPNNNILNPAEIESMEVLKDASATAIYGARGANGVIIITTKKGKLGAPTLTFDTYYGVQQDTRKMALMDPYNFIKYQNELDSNRTKNTFFSNGRNLESYRNAKGVDWQGLLFRTAPMTDCNLEAL